MKFLFCCEFYYPSVGGVQEVMRHIAERMVKAGHHVTVATSRLTERDFSSHNGVFIEEFSVSGNFVRGMVGDVEKYQQFVLGFSCDAILIKAAQQWTFDGLWDVLDKVDTRKVFIPCGFSGLFEPSYIKYFQLLPDILKKFDHLIFYADHYRDTDFARELGLDNWSILPNGASEVEFEVEKDLTFRARNGIPEDAIVLLTVGSFTGVKGHREVAEAVECLKTSRSVVLLLNGNQPPCPVVPNFSSGRYSLSIPKFGPGFLEKIGSFVKTSYARCVHYFERFAGLAYRSFGVIRLEGWVGVKYRVFLIIGQHIPALKELKIFSNTLPSIRSIDKVVESINSSFSGKKKAFIVDFPREQLVQAFMAADLFVFASNIEYSPLVLFETAAAGTPFLSVPVGNADEIAAWTEGGVICPADKDERGYTRADPKVLASKIQELMNRPDDLAAMGLRAREKWRQNFTWEVIAKRYEAILLNQHIH